MASEGPRQCVNCDQKLDGAYVRCSACKQAFYCTVDCQRTHWPTHSKSCASTPKSTSKETLVRTLGERDAPTHNLTDWEVDTVKENAMMEDFYKWRKIWYSTIVRCIISMLSCEPYGLEKLRTHGLAIWAGERAEYGNLEASKLDIQERATKNKWKWNINNWHEATAFKVAHVRLVPWNRLIEMLECFPMEQTFMDSFRTLSPPGTLRIVAFVAPSFLSYDNQQTVSRGSFSRQGPLVRWEFPPTSRIHSDVRDLIYRTMPFFEPLVTTYKTSGTTDPDDRTRYANFDSDAWEWIIKRVVDLGWYSDDGNNWRGFIDKVACKDCKGQETIPGEVKTGLAYMNKVDKAAKRQHNCSASSQSA